MEADSTRDRLVAAARRLFAERGYESVGTREIVAEADCNIALIKHYFGSKEGLLYEAIGTNMASVRAVLEDLAREDGSFRGRIERFVDVMVDLLAREQDGVRIVTRELMDPKSVLAQRLGPFIRANIDGVMQLIVEAKGRGEVGDVDPATCATLLFGLLQFYFTASSAAAPVMGSPSPELLASLKSHIARIFLDGVTEHRLQRPRPAPRRKKKPNPTRKER